MCGAMLRQYYPNIPWCYYFDRPMPGAIGLVGKVEDHQIDNALTSG
jgi:hypothetical protein